MNHGRAGKLEIVQFDAAGVKAREFAVDVESSSSPSDAFMTPPQLIAAGKQLALVLAPPMRTRPGRAPGGEVPGMKCYIIEPQSGAVSFSGDLGPVAPIEPEAADDLRSLQALWKAVREAQAGDEKAAQGLVAGGDGAVAAIRLGMPPAAPAPDAAALRDEVAALDSDDWKRREEAAASLLAAGSAAESQLRAARDGTASQEARQRIDAILRQLEQVRAGGISDEAVDKALGDTATRARLRAARVLARIGTPAAVQLLREIAGGPAGSADALEARKALARL
jgi:hypothetical protein